MSKKTTAHIQDIYQIAHDSKSKGIDINITLQKYGISKRVFYYKCKRAGLDTWRLKNRDIVIVEKPIKTNHQKDKHPKPESDAVAVIRNQKVEYSKIPLKKSGQGQGLVGGSVLGSLQKSLKEGNMYNPKKEPDTIDREIASNLRRIEAAKRKNPDLDI